MRYLVSGGSGYLGNALIDRIYKDNDIVVVARNEGQLVKLKEKYPNIEIITGDISSKFICRKAFKKHVDGVFHLAAFKHIVLAEENVQECIKSNVLGTINLLAAVFVNKPEFIIGISTDKAAQVSGVYGATKLLMERLFKEYEELNPKTKYRIVRYGNVIYSTGSVLCKWKEKIRAGEEITVTDVDSTRFYWTVEQAVDLMFSCLNGALDCSPYCPDMKAVRLGDLLGAMIDKYSDGKKIKLNHIGLQPSENMHETIDGKIFSNQVEMFTKEEIKELI